MLLNLYEIYMTCCVCCYLQISGVIYPVCISMCSVFVYSVVGLLLYCTIGKFMNYIVNVWHNHVCMQQLIKAHTLSGGCA